MAYRHRILAFAALVTASSSIFAAPKPAVLDGVTFASAPGLFVPVREVARALAWSYTRDPVTEIVTLKGTPIGFDEPSLRDGTRLISLGRIAKRGAKLSWSGDKARLADSGRILLVRRAPKRVVIDLRAQKLRAYEGGRLVLETRVSSGRAGKDTPTGRFAARLKEPMHISTIYGSPMPYSVQIVGNIFIHGSSQFYDGVGSHGCIRLETDDAYNTARWFYDWVRLGTPVAVVGRRPVSVARNESR